MFNHILSDLKGYWLCKTKIYNYEIYAFYNFRLNICRSGRSGKHI